jgi:hypothetical protein
MKWAGSCYSTTPQRGLTFVAASMLSLLTLAIRNSWTIAIGLVFIPPGRH